MQGSLIRKIICSTFFVFGLLNISITQVTFNKTFDFTNGDETGYSVIGVEGGIILIGHGLGYEAGNYEDTKVKYMKIDDEGNVLWQKFISDSSFKLYANYLTGCKAYDGNIVFTGSRDSIGHSDIYIAKINSSSGDLMFFKILHNFNWRSGYMVRQFSDSSLIILGVDETVNHTLLTKTSSEGELIWNKTVGSVGENSSDLFNVENDSFYLINRNLFCSPEGYYIRQLDSAGNIISVDYFDEECLGAGFQSKIGGFYGIGVSYPDYPFNSYVYRLTDSGVFIWKYSTSWDIDTIFDNELYTIPIEEFENGDLLITGYYATNPYGYYSGYIAKVDINGNPIWERQYYSNSGYDNRLNDIELTEDGGILVLGGARNENFDEDQNFWVLKLDSIGCVIPGCDTLADGIFELPFDKTGMVIFPNPFVDEAIIQFTIHGNNDVKNLKLEITDLLGKVVKSSEISTESALYTGNKINIPFQRNNISKGVYLCTIYSNNIYLKSMKMIIK